MSALFHGPPKLIQALGSTFAAVTLRLVARTSIEGHLGYTTKLTGTTGDHGVDILVDKPGERAVVQCKRYKGSVGEPVLRDLYGAMHAHGADRAFLATTGVLTRAAAAWARDKAALVVWDGQDLVRLSMRLATTPGGQADHKIVEIVPAQR